MNINKRIFTGSSVPTCSPLGKLLINSKESSDISKAIRDLKVGEVETVKLSPETLNNIEKLKNK